MRSWMVVPLLIVLAVVGAVLVDAPAPTPSPRGAAGDGPVADVDRPVADAGEPTVAGIELVSFDSCQALADDLATLAVQALEHAGLPWFGPGGRMQLFAGVAAAEGAAGGDDTAGSGPTSSDAGTNVQIAGVDEADRAKLVDGRLVTLDSGTLRVVEVDGPQPVEVGQLRVDVPADRMLVAGDRVLLMATDAMVMPLGPLQDQGSSAAVPDLLPVPRHQPTSTFVLVDLADPTAPREVERLEVDGFVVAGRLADGVARLVVRSEATLPFVAPTGGGLRGEDLAREENEAIIRAAEADEWLPWAIRTDADGTVIEEGPLVECDRVTRSTRATDLAVTSVVGIDLSGGLDRGSPAAVVGGGDVVHATTDAVVIAAHTAPPGWWQRPDDDERVGVHRWSTEDPTVPQWTGSGSVPGRLLGQWALDEHDGILRVATTTSWGPQAESAVVTLDAQAADLAELGRVDGLGPGETIQAVRFMGDAGYVVTFEQIDPLFVLDLGDPRAPREVGELEMPGFSAYLHPVGPGELVGVGRDGTSEGADTGAQISLFDVGEPTDPRRVDKLFLGEGWSEVDGDHHAFGWDADRGLAFVPLASWDADKGRDLSEIVVARAGDGVLQEVERVELTAPAYGVRPLVLDDRLVTATATSVTVVDLDTFEQVGEPLVF
jgi:uncharacterized secreted protein with C-terminal beta-propeller domain